MAIKLYMTWEPDTRRWHKKYRGKSYKVSCRQLGVPDTKAESWRAANSWWEAKLAELKGPAPASDEARGLQVTEMLRNADPVLLGRLLGLEVAQEGRERITGGVEAIITATPTERLVGTQVANWKRLLRGVCEAGKMSEGRLDAYSRHIGIFSAWLGPDKSIDTLGPARFQAWFEYLSSRVASGEWSANYCNTILMTSRQWISHLAELELITPPRNLRSRRMRFGHSIPRAVEVFSIQEVRDLLTACAGWSERTRLYILLMLNCGMYQNDLAELRRDEVDWDAGVVTRKRSKTRERDTPTVSYHLWPETFQLLKQFRATSGDLALLTEDGNPLVRYWTVDGRFRHYDSVRSCWERLGKKMGSKIRLGPKHLRKTGASLLATHPQYKFYCNHYLADSPRAVADKHYVIPDQEEFDRALSWLGNQILE